MLLGAPLQSADDFALDLRHCHHRARSDLGTRRSAACSRTCRPSEASW